MKRATTKRRDRCTTEERTEEQKRNSDNERREKEERRETQTTKERVKADSEKKNCDQSRKEIVEKSRKIEMDVDANGKKTRKKVKGERIKEQNNEKRNTCKKNKQDT